jgi:predicted nucleotidyltransferase
MGTNVGSSGDALFNKTRQAVLALLYGHPDQRYYQRQIIELLDLGSGTVQRELEQLARSGILTRVLEGRQTYFQANQQCPIFHELRGLVRKTFGIVDVLAAALKPLAKRIEIAFVFGSIARGTEGNLSDVDLMVIGEATLMDVVGAVRDAQRELGREINPSVYPVEEFRRKLAAGEHFVARVVEGEKIFLISDEQRLKRLAEVRMAQRAQDKPRGGRRPNRRG